MKTAFTSETLGRLLEASNYRSFIQIWMELRGRERKFGYADVARAGGFSARSFPRDVVTGSKRLTPSSLTKFSKGLYLSGDFADYFRVLVEIEHEDCRTKITDTLKLYEMKTRLKERIVSKHGHSGVTTDVAYRVSSLPEVYAALGSTERGASILEIQKRSSLEAFEIEAALDHMVRAGIAVKKKARYFPRQTHLSFEGLKQSEIFQKHFIWNSERSSRMAKTGLSSDSKLFLSSAFSVNQSDLPKLKEELRSVLLKFVDSAERTDGNKVVNMVSSLF